MKIRMFFIILLSANALCAQEFWFDEKSKADPYLKGGEFIFSATMAYPNWGAFNMKQFFKQSYVSEGITGGVAPITLTANYMYNSKVSFSLISMYNAWGGSWKQDSFVGPDTEYNFMVHRVRVLFACQYHFFDLNVKKTDFYVGGALGGNTISVNYSSDNPDWSPRQNNYFMDNNLMENGENLEFPITLRLHAGMRYFFNENWGAKMELSYGGGSINFGLCYKL